MTNCTAAVLCLCLLLVGGCLQQPAAAAAQQRQKAKEVRSSHSKLKAKPGTVVELSDSTFDEHVTDGVWFVDIYATWCSHCRQLEPIWRELAKDFADSPQIHVAKANGDMNRVLMARFGADAFPALYLLKDGRTWQYTGPRKLEALREFVVEGYKAQSPEPLHRCPNSSVGRVLGRLYQLPGRAHAAYKHLRDERGWSDLAILTSVLAVPVITGAVTLCALDAMAVRSARNAGNHSDEDQQNNAAGIAGGAAGGAAGRNIPQAVPAAAAGG